MNQFGGSVGMLSVNLAEFVFTSITAPKEQCAKRTGCRHVAAHGWSQNGQRELQEFGKGKLTDEVTLEFGNRYARLLDDSVGEARFYQSCFEIASGFGRTLKTCRIELPA